MFASQKQDFIFSLQARIEKEVSHHNNSFHGMDF
jgi:hypothetical protein